MGRIDTTRLVAYERSVLATNPAAARKRFQYPRGSSRIGVSRWYAGKIRQGYRPHPRHWEPLAELVGLTAV